MYILSRAMDNSSSHNECFILVDPTYMTCMLDDLYRMNAVKVVSLYIRSVLELILSSLDWLYLYDLLHCQV